MMYVTTERISGKRVLRVLGLVRGNTIRSRHLGKDLLAVLKNVVGGEIEEYTKMMGEAREQAVDRMLSEARALGGNAVIGVRFSTSMMMSAASEIMAYGTAVLLEDEPS